MEFLIELIGEFIIEIVIGGSLELLKSKNTPRIIKCICMIIWIGIFAVFYLIVISLIKGRFPVIGYLSLVFILILTSCFIYHMIKGMR